MNAREKRFIETVWEFYKNGEGQKERGKLPWRQKSHTQNPYKIIVSEVMLQQTQVDRVVLKYRAFLKRFPSVRALASAPLGDVLVAWQGLGYNRRAKMLQQMAKEVVDNQGGKFPKEYEGLLQLPGIGPYTAGAVSAFSYNQAVPIIETNIRTVYLHHFFAKELAAGVMIDDAAIMKLIKKTLDQENPREWYWALMDYGAHLKKTVGNLNRGAKAYQKQSTFAGSDRQIRGAIVRVLAGGKGAAGAAGAGPNKLTKLTRNQLHQALSQFEDIRIDAQLEKLIVEALVEKNNECYRLAD